MILERLVFLRERLGFFPVVDAALISVELPGRAGFTNTADARRMTPSMREAHFLGVVVVMSEFVAEMGIESVVGVVKSACRVWWLLD